MDPNREVPAPPDPGSAAATPAGAEDLSTGRGWWNAVRESLSGKERDYTQGGLSRAIMLLAIPMVLEMAMESVFAVVDIFFVGRLGEDAVAAVGITESLLTIIYSLALGLAMATTAMVARRIGEKKPEAASLAGTQAIVLGSVFALVIGLPGCLLASELLTAMGAPAGVVEIGSGYTSLMMASNVVIVLLFVNNAVFRGAGDPAIAMRALWLANGINIVLDPVLIFGLGPFPELGLLGAAIATTTGRGTGVLYQFWALRRGRGRVALRGDALRIDFDVLLRLLRVSWGGIAQFLIATSSWVVLMRLIAPFGSIALAGYTIGIRILIFAILPSWGLCNAAATLVGQNLGAKDPQRAERAVWLTGLYNTVFMVLVTVFFLLFAEPLVGIFTQDPAVQAVGAECLRVISYGYVFYAWGMVMVQAFNGAGDTMTPTWVNLACYWAFQIPLAFTLAHGVAKQASGVFWAIVISESVYAVVCVLLFRRGRWKSKQV